MNWGRRRMLRIWVGATVLSLVGLAVAGNASDWPQFRGPGSTGLAEDGKLPAEWSADRNTRGAAPAPLIRGGTAIRARGS